MKWISSIHKKSPTHLFLFYLRLILQNHTFESYILYIQFILYTFEVNKLLLLCEMKKNPIKYKKYEASLNSFVRKREQMANWFATASTVPKTNYQNLA